MDSADRDRAIARAVARRAATEARAAVAAAREHPTDERLRSAYRACVFAARALRRGSEGQSKADETAMIEASIRFDEQGYGLRRELLADAIEPASTP